MKIPKDYQDIAAMREFLTNVRQQVCSMGDCLSEPWKTHYNDLKSQYDSALAALPPTDQVPAAMDASRHLSCFFSCLANANALVGMLGSAMNSMSKGNETAVAQALNSALPAEIQKRITAGELVAKAALDGLITAAVEARTKSGDLVAKDTVLQLCSAATAKGLADGEKKVRDEQSATAAVKLIIDRRKGILQTAGLPVPDATLEQLLGGTDDEFAAAQKRAGERIGALQKKGIALNSKSPLGPKVWLPEDQWTVFADLAEQTIKGGDPLVPAPSASGTQPPKVMLA